MASEKIDDIVVIVRGSRHANNSLIPTNLNQFVVKRNQIKHSTMAYVLTQPTAIRQELTFTNYHSVLNCQRNLREQLHSTGPVGKCINLAARLAWPGMKERGIIYI